MKSIKIGRIYGRFSSKPQEHGDSFRRQVEGATAYAAKNGIELVKTNDKPVVYFDEGVSGKAGANLEKEFGRLLIEAKAGEIILCEETDRIGRQHPIEVLNIIKSRIIDKGLSIVFWKTDLTVDRTNIDNPAILFSLFGGTTVSFTDNSRKMNRIRESWENKRAIAKDKPLTATCPSWVKAIFSFDERGRKSTTGFELIPAHAAIVKRIFEMSLNGMGNQAITKLFNKEGVKGIGGVDSWHTSVIDRILRNRAVLGEFQPMKWVEKDGKKEREPVGEPIKNYYPKVNGITEPMFNAVQFKRKERTTNGGRRDYKGTIGNLFTSICRCGFCDSNMTYTAKRSNTLVCDNARRGKGCRYVGYKYEEFETSFLTYVRELNLSEILNSNPDDTKLNVQIEQCRAVIDATQTKINNLGEAIAIGKGKSLIAMIDKLESELELQRHNLKELTAKQAASHVEVIKVNELKELIAKAQNTGAKNINEIRMALREAIRSIVTKIEVFPYELCKPIKRSELNRTELRKTTKAGFLIDCDYQTVERCYRVWFKNENSYREIFSHPKRVFSAKGFKKAA